MFPTRDSYDPQMLRNIVSGSVTQRDLPTTKKKLTIVNGTWNAGQYGKCSECGGIQDPGFIVIG
jgi:hypothetical protein